MTQGAEGPSLPDASALSAPPSMEHVRALEAASDLGMSLGARLGQRPLFGYWECEADGKAVTLCVVDACGTPTEWAKTLGGARALLVLDSPSRRACVQPVTHVAEYAGAFVVGSWFETTANDLSVLRWPVAGKLEFMLKVCDGLSALHDAAIVHGCLCLDNIMLGESFAPVLAEAGMVSVAEALDGDRENVFGYGAFAAPEARTRAGSVIVESDVYSVGRLLLALLLDRTPTTSVVDIAEIGTRSPGLVPLLQKCLAESPADRHASIAELRQELEKAGRAHLSSDVAGAARPRSVPPPSAATPSKPPPARRSWNPEPHAARSAWPLWSGAVFVGVAAGALALSFFLTQLSNDATLPLSIVIAVAAAIATVSIPVPLEWQVRRAIRVLLAVAPGLAVAAWNPVARVAGHGTLYGLLGDDAPSRAGAARVAILRGRKGFSHARLGGADLSGLDLSGAELDRADLSLSNLTGTSLQGAKLEGASLMLARLQGADLSGTTLDHTSGIEAAHCDATTTLPSGWYCDASSLVHKGKAPASPP